MLQSALLVPLGLGVTLVGFRVAGVSAIRPALLLAAIFIPIALCTRFIAAIFQGRLNMGAFYGIRISMQATIVVVLSVLLVAGRVTIWSTMLAYVAGLLVMGAVSLVLARRDRVPAQHQARVRSLFGYGMRSLAGGIYPVEGLFIDQVIVAFMLGARDLGLYVVALAFTSVPRLIATAVATPVLGHVAGTKDRDLPRTLRAFVGTGLAYLVPAGALLIALTPALLPLLFGAAFKAAVVPAQLLLAGSICFGVRRILGEVLRGAGRPGLVSMIEGGSWPLVVIAIASSASYGLTVVTAALLIVQVAALGAMAVGAIAGSGLKTPPATEAAR